MSQTLTNLGERLCDRIADALPLGLFYTVTTPSFNSIFVRCEHKMGGWQRLLLRMPPCLRVRRLFASSLRRLFMSQALRESTTSTIAVYGLIPQVDTPSYMLVRRCNLRLLFPARCSPTPLIGVPERGDKQSYYNYPPTRATVLFALRDTEDSLVAKSYAASVETYALCF